MVTSDISPPPGSSSAPAEPPRGGPPTQLCCFPPQSRQSLAPVYSQTGFGGSVSCKAWMDNYPGVKPTSRCNEWQGSGGAKPPGGMEKGVEPEEPAKPVSTAALHTAGPITRSNHRIKAKKRGECKTHTHFPIRDMTSPPQLLYSHVHMWSITSSVK